MHIDPSLRPLASCSPNAPHASEAPCASAWRLHQAPTQPVDPDEDAPLHPHEPPVPEPGLPEIQLPNAYNVAASICLDVFSPKLIQMTAPLGCS